MAAGTVAAMCCGCGGRVITKTTTAQPSARPVAKDATREELIERYNVFARGIQTLSATVELKPIAGSAYSGVIQEYHEVKAFLLVAQPASVRVIGQVPIVGKTAFDMASDGTTFQVSIPSRNKFLVGSVANVRTSEKPIENLRPEHLLEAFLWPEIRNGEEVLLEEFDTDTGRYYVLTVLRGGYRTEILRKVWFDRSDLQVSRLENFAPKGLLMADIQLADWRATDATAAGGAAAVPAGSAAPLANFAHAIGISRPHDDYRLDLQVSKITINEPIATSRFQLLQPPGSELVQVREANAAKDQKP
jgi:hypothetical protein